MPTSRLLPIRLALLGMGLAVAQAAPAVADEKAASTAQVEARTDLYGDPLPAGAVARVGTGRLRQGEWFRSIAMSPDGKVLAGADRDSTCLWEVPTGKLLRRLLQTKSSGLHSLAFSPDGAVLATSEFARPQAIGRLWDVATGKELRHWPQPGGSPVTFTPDGQGLLLEGEKTITLAELASGKELRKFQLPTDRIGFMALSPNGKILAATGYNKDFSISKSVYVWDVATGKPLPTLALPPSGGDPRFDGALCLAFSPDGKTLLVTDRKNNYLWDWAAGKQLGRIGREGGQAPGAFSPDCKLLAAADPDGDCLWEVNTGKKRHQLELPWGKFNQPYGGNPFAFTPDGKVLAKRYSNLNAVVLLWDVATGKLLNQPREAHFYPIEEIAVSPDGTTLASRNVNEDIRLWDISTGKPLHRIPTQSPVGLAFLPDGKALMSASWDGTLQRWDPAAGKELARFAPERGEALSSLTVVNPGAVLASGYRDGRVVLWNPATGQRLRQFQPHPVQIDRDGERYAAPVAPLAFSPNGKTMAFGNDHYELSLAHGQTGRVLHHLKTESRVLSLAFSPDGKTLASTGPTGKKVIRLWETATGKERLRIGEDGNYAAYFHSVTFSADGKTLASGGADGAIRFWDVASGQEIGRLDGHHGAVTALAFLSDGRLVSGSADTTILVWENVRFKKAGAVPPTIPEKELATLWTHLAGEDAHKAFHAIHTLAGAAASSVPFLNDRLAPVPRPNGERIARLINDLDGRQFEVRQKAAAELETLEEQAEHALQQVLTGKPSLELRNRVEQLLEKLAGRLWVPKMLFGCGARTYDIGLRPLGLPISRHNMGGEAPNIGAGFRRWPDVQAETCKMVFKRASCHKSQVVGLVDDMITMCAVQRRWFPAGESPARRTGSLQPEAIGAAAEVTKPSKPSMSGRFQAIGEQTGRNVSER